MINIGLSFIPETKYPVSRELDYSEKEGKCCLKCPSISEK
jgi:hypothetical protein